MKLAYFLVLIFLFGIVEPLPYYCSAYCSYHGE
jgi:hypothetical protein